LSKRLVLWPNLQNGGKGLRNCKVALKRQDRL
jgi:hypothetical protein